MNYIMSLKRKTALANGIPFARAVDLLHLLRGDQTKTALGVPSEAVQKRKYAAHAHIGLTVLVKVKTHVGDEATLKLEEVSVRA